ncbi:DUF1223 domain-containing protein [Methylobacterium sp. WL6]|uniref:DUF1223 domain-containing protein n=1 Tax=Methylobacterium sp. WL6 TaxID=2603901 RepID=UPI0011C93B5A|nr:DUF1223 domain-containing protein [Methylobacterium sp. WL6]TXN65444.1 DUF1223 domain-containing protein [Methylobacterium sp. WL6]
MTATHARSHAFVPIRVLLAALAAGLPCGPAAAEPLRAVVELFTSQGCAACRSADPVIGDLARQPGILALTLPVTYWDYLGWKDTLAQRPFGERQHAYSGVHGARQMFTPQAVINGSASTVASDRAALEKLLREANARGGLPVPVRGEERDERILIEIGAEPVPKADLKGDVWLVPVLRSRPVAIGGGENRGRTATYVNVVRGLQRLGPWTGQAVRFEVPRTAARVAEADAWVVVVQGTVGGRPARIFGAAKGPGL